MLLSPTCTFSCFGLVVKQKLPFLSPCDLLSCTYLVSCYPLKNPCKRGLIVPIFRWKGWELDFTQLAECLNLIFGRSEAKAYVRCVPPRSASNAGQINVSVNGIFVSLLHKILYPWKMKCNLLGFYAPLVCSIYMVILWHCFYRLTRNIRAKNKWMRTMFLGLAQYCAD